jgi:hypothetical protein
MTSNPTLTVFNTKGANLTKSDRTEFFPPFEFFVD